MRGVKALVLLVACLAGVVEGERAPVSQRFSEALVLLESGQFVEARAMMHTLAAANHVEAQAAYAAMVLKGIGGPRSVAEAMGWYCRLAHQPAGGREVVHALWFLAEYFRTGGALPGSDYQAGELGKENPLKALFWFRLLALQGNYYQQVVAPGVRLGRLGAVSVTRQLLASEVQQVEAALARWRPGLAVDDAKQCLALP